MGSMARVSSAGGDGKPAEPGPCSVQEDLLGPVGALFMDRLARLGTGIITEPNHGTRLGQDRHHAIEQRLAGDRLFQELVDAEARCLDHAPTLHIECNSFSTLRGMTESMTPAPGPVCRASSRQV